MLKLSCPSSGKDKASYRVNRKWYFSQRHATAMKCLNSCFLLNDWCFLSHWETAIWNCLSFSYSSFVAPPFLFDYEEILLIFLAKQIWQPIPSFCLRKCLLIPPSLYKDNYAECRILDWCFCLFFLSTTL